MEISNTKINGFKLQIKDENIKVSVEEDRNLHLLISGSSRDNYFNVVFIGGSIDSHVTWYRSELQLGDTMTITPINQPIQENPIPFEISPVDDEVLLKSYKALKERLTQKGLL